MNTNKVNFYLVMSLLVLSVSRVTSATAFVDSSIISKVKQQVSSIHWHSLSDRGDWGYTVATMLINGSGKKQQRIQSYDPSKPLASQWQLLEQEYQVPSKATLHEYSKSQQAIATEEIPEQSKGIEIIDKSTLKFSGEDALYYVFTFTPRLPMFKPKINQKFEGKLYFNKRKKNIEKLHLKATESFSVGLSMEIKNYEMNIVIKAIAGQLHVTHINSDKSGTLLFFNDFKEYSSRDFSNFHTVLPKV